MQLNTVRLPAIMTRCVSRANKPLICDHSAVVSVVAMPPSSPLHANIIRLCWLLRPFSHVSCLFCVSLLISPLLFIITTTPPTLFLYYFIQTHLSICRSSQFLSCSLSRRLAQYFRPCDINVQIGGIKS